MKLTRFFLLFSSLLIMLSSKAQDQTETDSTGLPGDNFSLQGALEMFKKASSPEEFEKLINSKDNTVNNLDLNEDGEIDYVKVIDQTEKDVHLFILQVPVSATENQDIAVIELEKTGDASAIIQIAGDEDIYGNEIIVEPVDSENATNTDYINDGNFTKGGKGMGADAEYYSTHPGIIVNVWMWPSVRFIYAPAYVGWRSPWRWHSYPAWWRPWRPLAWHVYHPLSIRYYRPYAIVHTHRVVYARRMYTPVRVTSVTVRTRNRTAINNYRVTRTRTTVTGPGGNRLSRKSTTVHGPRGNKVRSTKTTVRKRR